MMTQTKPNKANRPAFTLVELLVVISIMAALTALMLPRLRTVNQDRGIREAARVVGSKFAEASDRARRDGAAAVTLIRNPNMVDVDGVLFGASTIFLSRAVPNFIGDDGASATMQSDTVIRVPRPLEYEDATPQENVIRVGDTVRISESSPVTSTVAYEIVNFRTTPAPPAGFLDLVLDVKPTQPDPPSSGSVSYVIQRQPKILRSSITELPSGHIIDLRLSGPVAVMENGSGETSAIAAPPAPRIGNPVRPLFNEIMRPALAADQTSNVLRSRLAAQYSRVDIFFDSTGGVSSVRTYRGNWDNTASLGVDTPQPVSGPLQLFVSPTELEEGVSPLYSETNLWVTVSNNSGGVSIGYNNPPLAAGPTLADLVTEARIAASTGVSASQ